MTNADETYLEITRNRGPIMAVIVAMIPDFGDVEDVFQDTVLEIIRHKDRYDGSRPFLPWARGIARNMARRHYSAKARTAVPVDPESLDTLTDVVMEDSGEERWHESMERLHVCLARLSQRNRRLVLLRYGQNLKGGELARQAGLGEKSTRTTLFRLREFLRKCMEKLGGEAVLT